MSTSAADAALSAATESAFSAFASARPRASDSLRGLQQERFLSEREVRPAFADRAMEQAAGRGAAISALTANEPADSPKIVTADGSPPNAAMFSLTHRSAATMSSSP